MEIKKLTCEQVRQFDLVDYLSQLGYKPAKTRNNDYWYLSPLREEREASFKVNRRLNVWYDFGIGKGGDLIDFGVLYHHCTIHELLERFPQNIFSFHPHFFSTQKPSDAGEKGHNKNITDNLLSAGEKKINITEIKTISNASLCRYLHDRRIPLDTANHYCKEVLFELNGKNYYAIGFKNNAGGYELRNQFFKGSGSPKDITLIENNNAEQVSVFEGFFSFLSYHSIHKNQEQPLTNFLVLNSLSFFERSRSLLEKHRHVHLYLDRDKAGLKQTQEALKISHRYKDASIIYKGYKDMNDWLRGKRMINEQRLHHGRAF